MLSATRLIQEDPTAKIAFRVIADEGGKASGWQIAKSQDVEPGAVSVALASLKSLGVVESTGMGLEGYYYLTSLGFRLRELLPRSLAR